MSLPNNYHDFSNNPLNHLNQIDEISISEDIIRYLINLSSDREAVTPFLLKLSTALTMPHPLKEKRLLEIYHPLTDYLINTDKYRKFSEYELNQAIKINFNLNKATEGLALLFLDEKKQVVKLAILLFNQILRNSHSILDNKALKTLINEVSQSQRIAAFEFDNNLKLTDLNLENNYLLITRSLVNLYSLLFNQLSQITGAQPTLKLFEQNYLDIREIYGDYLHVFPELITLLPSQVLPEERLTTLSREKLAEKVKEQTKQLQLQLENLTLKNQELEKNKIAMLNLLEDAKELEEMLKKEKQNVELKVAERTKQLKEEQAQLQASINSINMGFILTDTEANILTINPIARHMLCASTINGEDSNPGSITNNNFAAIGESCSIEDVERDLKEVFDLKKTIKEVAEQKNPKEIKELQFKNLYLRIFITPVVTLEENVFNVSSCVVLIENITEEKVIARSRDEFFSIASHELRTPLTAIRGNASMVLQYYQEQLKDPQLKEMVDDIHESSIRLIEIVNDFLDTSRLEQGRMQFKIEPQDIAEIITNTIKEYSVTGSRRNVYVGFDQPHENLPKVLGDKDKIKQILINLVGNALKFTEQGSITVKALSQADHLKILVTDTGKGIAEENQKLLFRKFQQAGNSITTRDNTKGTGLGLYISKLLVEGMHGQIKLENSQVGIGTTFSFTLPIASN